MTSLSVYMRAERVDNTEPASFYAPGADSWNDPRLRMLRSRVAEAAGEQEAFVAALEHTRSIKDD